MDENSRCVHGVVAGGRICFECQSLEARKSIDRYFSALLEFEHAAESIQSFVERIPDEIREWKSVAAALTREKYLAEEQLSKVQEEMDKAEKRIQVLEEESRRLAKDVMKEGLPEVVDWVPQSHLDRAEEEIKRLKKELKEKELKETRKVELENLPELDLEGFAHDDSEEK